MKNLFILTALAGLIIAGCAKNRDEATTTLIRTPTMVCGNCAKTIKNAVVKLDGVEEVNADIGAKTVSVKYISSKINLESVERAITAAGYDANDKKRDPDAYEKLAKCCKIDG
jgi:mercuric ion binding protein